MRHAKNESRFVGTTFVPATKGGGIIRSKISRSLRFGKSRLIKALAELSPKQSEAGSVRLTDNETQALIKLRHYKHSAVMSVS